MKRSQGWNALQICPRRDSNSGGSDLWSNTLPLDHRGAPMITIERCIGDLAAQLISARDKLNGPNNHGTGQEARRNIFLMPTSFDLNSNDGRLWLTTLQVWPHKRSIQPRLRHPSVWPWPETECWEWETTSRGNGQSDDALSGRGYHWEYDLTAWRTVPQAESDTNCTMTALICPDERSCWLVNMFCGSNN